MAKKDVISAAGAVVLRTEQTDNGPRPLVLVVHRPQYDDWSLPKGKVEPGEVPAVCAVREVAEETGVLVQLEAPLDSQNYWVGKRRKQVYWWRASVVEEHPREADDEVDTVLWLTVVEAEDLLSYADDVDLLRQALETPETTNLIVVRHGKAMERRYWSGHDPARPLTRRGRTQSRRLVPVLEAFGVRRVVSSSSNRCVSTVLPFATGHQLTIERQTLLSEERGVSETQEVEYLIADLRREVLRTHTPLVICGHRPVLPAMLAGLDLPDRSFHTAECVVVSLDEEDQVYAVQWIRVD